VREFEADLHVHTALSPCAEEEMSPPAIVLAAIRRRLDMIAVCDHNGAANAAAVIEAAGPDLAVVAGMEITTSEEVHVLGLFPSAAAAGAAAAAVQASLPPATGETAARFGDQLVLGVLGEVVGRADRLLAAASALSLEEAVALVKRLGGLAIAAHVDRPSFSVFSQLGLFPEEAGFDAIEISAANATPPWAAAIGEVPLPVVRGSDAHMLSELGVARTRLRLEAATFDELALALAGRDGREVLR
jgi:predicted metal-dependent phosphoesterase TrpH